MGEGDLVSPLSFLLSLLQVLAFAHGGNFSVPSYSRIRRDLYHSSDSLMKQVKALVSRHPDRLSMETIRAQNNGYPAEISVVTFSLAESGTDESAKFRVLLTFGQHGRELITSEVALRVLTILSGEWKKYFLFGSSTLPKELDKLIIKVVPMENLNGRKLVEAGDTCERRNGRGVDLNRNWSIDWGKKEKDYDPYEENPGSSPFSEPETQIMRKLSKTFRPHMWVNVHSGMEALFMPYDHRNTTPNGLASEVMRSMLESINHHYCHDRCLVGSGGGSVGYLAHGTATDYIYDVVNVPLAFTIEIYGDLKASSKDCFRMFNPVDRNTFYRVLEDWSAVFIMMFEIAPNYLEKIRLKVPADPNRLVSISDYGDEVVKKGEEVRRSDMLDLGPATIARNDTLNRRNAEESRNCNIRAPDYSAQASYMSGNCRRHGLCLKIACFCGSKDVKVRAQVFLRAQHLCILPAVVILIFTTVISYPALNPVPPVGGDSHTAATHPVVSDFLTPARTLVDAHYKGTRNVEKNLLRLVDRLNLLCCKYKLKILWCSHL